MGDSTPKGEAWAPDALPKGEVAGFDSEAAANGLEAEEAGASASPATAKGDLGAACAGLEAPPAKGLLGVSSVANGLFGGEAKPSWGSKIPLLLLMITVGSTGVRGATGLKWPNLAK